MTSQTRTSARFSTYSGAPSLHPSLAPTFSTTKTAPNSARNTTTSTQLSEKNSQIPSSANPSLYTTNPAASTSTTTISSSDPKTQALKSWHTGFERMQDERLDKQRYVMNDSKSEEVKALALGAKLERALGRRMVGQDAVFSRERKEGGGEKVLEVEVN